MADKGTSPATNIPKTYSGSQAPIKKQGQTPGTKYGQDSNKRTGK